MVSKGCYSVKQIQVQAQKKLSISSRDHVKESTTRIFAQNWNDPYNAAELKSIYLKLPDFQHKSSLYVHNKGKRTTKEGKEPENKDKMSFVREPEIIHSLPQYKFTESSV